jgi:hypothetical protein
MIPLKYKLDKKSLEIMYTSFVLPSMLYANVVWGGAFDCDLMKLETIQVDAIRVITGATARSNIANLYKEVNIQKISKRIDNASLNVMYKIVHVIAPSYLNDLVLKEAAERPYNLRHKQALKQPFCRLETFQKSFCPRTISLWNNLSPQIQTALSLNEFKQSLKPVLDDQIVLYYYGERWPSVHHARMRIGCSKLNNDLCNHLHVINNPYCQCGQAIENAKHFFLDCPLYTPERDILINHIQRITDITVEHLLYGNSLLSLADNKRVFDAVHDFIKNSKRFN